MDITELSPFQRSAVDRMMDNFRALGKGDCWPYLTRSGDHVYAKFTFDHSSYQYDTTLTFFPGDDSTFNFTTRLAEWQFWNGRVSSEEQAASVTVPLIQSLKSSFIEGVEFRFVR